MGSSALALGASGVLVSLGWEPGMGGGVRLGFFGGLGVAGSSFGGAGGTATGGVTASILGLSMGRAIPAGGLPGVGTATGGVVTTVLGFSFFFS